MATSMSALLGVGSKPKRITKIMVGTGTHIPLEDGSRCLVRIQAGGAGGEMYNANLPLGGAAGAMTEIFIQIPIAGIAYAVGEGGIKNANSASVGSPSIFGNVASAPGNPSSSSTVGTGGLLAVGATGLQGGDGGHFSVPGRAAGNAAYMGVTGCGGSSFFGKGGAPGVNGGIGAGGGGNQGGGAGAGGRGCIEVWDYGA